MIEEDIETLLSKYQTVGETYEECSDLKSRIMEYAHSQGPVELILGNSLSDIEYEGIEECEDFRPI